MLLLQTLNVAAVRNPGKSHKTHRVRQTARACGLGAASSRRGEPREELGFELLQTGVGAEKGTREGQFGSAPATGLTEALLCAGLRGVLGCSGEQRGACVWSGEAGRTGGQGGMGVLQAGEALGRR